MEVGLVLPCAMLLPTLLVLLGRAAGTTPTLVQRGCAQIILLELLGGSFVTASHLRIGPLFLFIRHLLIAINRRFGPGDARSKATQRYKWNPIGLGGFSAAYIDPKAHSNCEQEMCVSGNNPNVYSIDTSATDDLYPQMTIISDDQFTLG